MKENTDRIPPEMARDHRKLEKLAREVPDPRELSNRVANSSESTADLFNSEYSPESEQGIPLPPQQTGSRPPD